MRGERQSSQELREKFSTHSSEGEVVEDLAAVFPCVRISVLLLHLIVESVDLSDLSALVVSSEESDLVWVSGLQQKQVGECLQTVVSSVYKISLYQVNPGCSQWEGKTKKLP